MSWSRYLKEVLGVSSVLVPTMEAGLGQTETVKILILEEVGIHLLDEELFTKMLASIGVNKKSTVRFLYKKEELNKIGDGGLSDLDQSLVDLGITLQIPQSYPDPGQLEVRLQNCFTIPHPSTFAKNPINKQLAWEALKKVKVLLSQ